MIELRRRYSTESAPPESRLPKGYQEVEYLENNSNSYILLDIELRNDSLVKVETSFYITKQFHHNYDMVIAGNDGTTGTRFGCSILRKEKSIRYEVPNTPRLLTDIGNIEIQKQYYLKVNTRVGSILNSEIISSETLIGNAIGYAPIAVFNRGSHFLEPFLGRISVFKLYIDEFKLCDLIPCFRKSDNEAGMYDLVSGEFYTNAGTGKFEVGPLVI